MDESWSLDGVTIENRALVDRVFGEWPSFHDQLVVGLRIVQESSRSATLELDIDAVASYEPGPDGSFLGRDWHRVTLRCHNIAQLLVDDWLPENIIAELRFRTIDAAGLDGRGVVLDLDPIGGCGGRVCLICTSVEVVAVQPLNADVHPP